MKHFLLLFAVFCSLFMRSQDILVEKIELEWLPNQLIQIDEKLAWHMPIVKDNSIDVPNRLPDYSKRWQVPNSSKIKSFELKNIVTKSISTSELLDVSVNNIEVNSNPKLQIVSTRNESHAYFKMTPLLKEGGRYKKIISFDIHYQLKYNTVSKRSYATNSVLASGQWYKFSVDTTGVHKIDKSFLNSLGLNVDNINPQNLSIYGNGGKMLPYRIGDFRYDDLQENAIYIEGEQDGSFDNNDYILFYAQGPDGWLHENTLNSLRHQKNIYTDKAYYFVFVKDQPAKRVTNATTLDLLPQLELTNFDDYIFHEIERKNLFQMGQQWMGETFDINSEQTISMSFPNIDTSAPVIVTTRAVASSNRATSLNVSIGNQDLYTLNIYPIYENDHYLAKYDTGTISLNINSADINVDLSYNNAGDLSANAYLDYIEIIGKKKLIAENKQFSFRNFETINTADPVSYSIQNASNIYNVWEVTDPINPKRIANQDNGNNFTFITNGGILKEYIVLNEQDYYTPQTISESLVQNQDLHALQDVDYVIITKDFLVSEAEVLAQYHRDNNDFNVKVIPLYQIYNEFGCGAPDITAIRDFVKFLYENSSPQLKYALLFGDASYDFKEIYEKNENIVPAFQSYNSFHIAETFVTDDFYGIVSDSDEGDLDDTNSVQSQDVAISRMPIRTIKEAREVIAKTLNYYKEVSLGDWRNQITMIADDADRSSDISLQTTEEAIADIIKLGKPVFNVKKIYADAYPQVISSGGTEYPEVNRAIVNSVEKGTLLTNYLGHGGEDGLAAERILTITEIESWNNFDKLTLIMIISCEFARFDNPSRPNTGGELVIRNPRGGGVHQIATARAVYITIGQRLNESLTPNILGNDNTHYSIADHLRIKKNLESSKQRFFVFSFGDPAMKLAIPKPDIKITHMNNVPVTQSLDTIKALSHVYFDGNITNQAGNIDTSFNGELSVTIFDKPVDKETLNNDDISGIKIFDTQESKIFRGSASVTNGEFSFDFVAPRDIRIAYGKGKLSFYADNGIKDKAGYNLDVTIGGINENAPEDNLGPTIQLYMNDKSFIDGGSTNQSPLFLAFFEDENGINTSLSAVDHDIVAILDDDQQNPIILNDYYTTELNDYSKGNLEYRLRNLEVGTHTIHLKAYDTYNNPGEATVNFVVLDDSELVLEHVLNYPNPFVNHTEFWFNHNKPNEPLEVQIQIYTVSGKLVKTINQLVQNTGSLSRDISWDGLDDFGQKIGKGVYIYKLSVNATLSDIKAEKFEKLVILQ